jgi:hypothetical protein
VLAVVAIVRSSNRRHQQHLLLRLVRTILRVVANPNRPIGWKIFDALFLSVGLVLVVVCLVNAGLDWLFLYFFFWPIVYVVTQRSWWEMPPNVEILLATCQVRGSVDARTR